MLHFHFGSLFLSPFFVTRGALLRIKEYRYKEKECQIPIYHQQLCSTTKLTCEQGGIIGK